jgi:hypothetical protein
VVTGASSGIGTAATDTSARPSGTSPVSAGAAPVTGWLAGKDWTAIPTTRPVVALTFDAGANADAVPSILTTLRREGIPATFFLTGDFVRDFPAAARCRGGARSTRRCRRPHARAPFAPATARWLPGGR